MNSSLLQVNPAQEAPAEGNLPEGVGKEKGSDRLSLVVPTKPILPPIPTILFGACFM